jgi:mannose-6-phosphate isomerase-like protein (cupin superfamily)
LPGQRLSYQKHKFRSEHWRVEEGEAEITLGAIDNPKKQTVRALVPGEAIDIECLAYHRAANPSQETVLIIYEWQRGFYDETDIVRIEDDYNRADNLQASP